MEKTIRDVVYGFIELDAQECQIVNHAAFQRLKWIKQLALTDMVYPGATHTRFEHSLGVMQMATDMYDCIVGNNSNKEMLKTIFCLEDSGIGRYRKLIRLAALLHDIGHPPFSHSGEDLMPLDPCDPNKERRYKHEQYSITIIKKEFRSIIENEPNYKFKAEDVTLLLGDTTGEPDALSFLWKELISGQLDADRADYLLRDSIHLGVKYGVYDRNMLVKNMTLSRDNETDSLSVAVKEKAWHVAEGLVIARYQMFTQVYFHKVRRIYDYHIAMATKEVLKNKGREDMCYPEPDNIEEYLTYDDTIIMAEIRSGRGGKHGDIIKNRNHYKLDYKTELIATEEEKTEINKRVIEYEGKEHYHDSKMKAEWYKEGKEIYIADGGKLQFLKTKSRIVESMMVCPTLERFYIPK